MSTVQVTRSGRLLPGAGFWLALVLLAGYFLVYSGRFHAIDEVSVAAMTESLVKHGEVSTDQIWWSQAWTPSQGRVGPDGHLYSKKGLGSALLGVPFFWLALHVPEMGTIRALMLANGLVTALTGWLLYACVLRLGYRPSVAILVALGFGLGTMAWPYAKYFFSEPLTALGLMLALWGLLSFRESGRLGFVVAAGAGLGMAVLAKVANVVTWPLFGAYAFWTALHRSGPPPTRTARRLALFSIAFLLPMVLSGLVLVWYNLARTGQWLDLGYAADETFSTPLAYGLAGLLLSPGKSLFLYSPILLAGLLGIPALLRRDRATALLSLGISLVYLFVYARWFMWWGGWSWGPRFLVPVLPFLAFFLAPVVDWALQPGRGWARALLAVLAFTSVLVQILGATVDFNQYLLLLYERGLDSGEINFRPELSPLLGHLSLLRQGVLDLGWAPGLVAGEGVRADGSAATRGAVDLGRLVWPVGLACAALAGWCWVRSARSRSGGLGQLGVWLLALAGLVLVAGAMVALARLPDPADDWQSGSSELSTALQEVAQPQDRLVVDLLPYADHLGRTTALMDRYKAMPAYWGWARQEPISAERQALLTSLDQESSTLWLALDTTPETDPASTTERWFDENAFRVEQRWLSPALRLVRYQLAGEGLPEDPQADLKLRLGDRLWLEGFSLSGRPRVRAGEVLPFALYWRTEEPVEQGYAVFVQLLDQAGRLRAQVDRQPVGGFRPTYTWQPGELIRDNYGLLLPADLPPGEYQIIAGLYLPDSLERLAVRTAAGAELGDYAHVGTIAVAEGGQP